MSSKLTGTSVAELTLTLEIARAVHDAGGRAVIIGGWVRDRLLNKQSKDIDLEIYNLPEPQLRTMLERIDNVSVVGEAFAVFKVGAVDVALPRRDSKTGRGHRGFRITGEPDLSIDEAARRRDFTINTIAWDPLTEEYLDPVGGLADLEKKILRAVDLRTFGDDSLRVLRAIQFAARFELEVDEPTKTLCNRICLDDLPAERVWGEFDKLLRQAVRPSIGFHLAFGLGVVQQLFPELSALVECPQEPEWHPEGDVWTHTLMVIDRAREVIDDLENPKQVTIMLGAVCHDFGKPTTTAWRDGRLRSFNHEEAGVAPTLTFLDRLKVNCIDGYDVRRQVTGLVAHHLKPGMWHKAQGNVGDGAFRRLSRKVDLELLARLAKADCLGRSGVFDCSGMGWFLSRARALGVEHSPPAALLKGRHLLALNQQPGPRIGRILSEVYDQQLDGSITNVEEAIETAKKIMRRKPE